MSAKPEIPVSIEISGQHQKLISFGPKKKLAKLKYPVEAKISGSKYPLGVESFRSRSDSNTFQYGHD